MGLDRPSRGLRHPPGVRWFPLAAKDDLPATTPNVWSWSAGALYGRVAVEADRTISAIHAHVGVAHASGTLSLEVWRNRGQGYGSGSSPGTMTRIATVSIGDSENDGGTIAFTISDPAVEAGDYLHMQATAKAGGAGWSTHVDIHFPIEDT